MVKEIDKKELIDNLDLYLNEPFVIRNYINETEKDEFITSLVAKLKTKSKNEAEINSIENLNLILAKLQNLVWTRFVLVNYLNLSPTAEDIPTLITSIVPDLATTEVRILKTIDNFVIFEISSVSATNSLKVNKSLSRKVRGYMYEKS